MDWLSLLADPAVTSMLLVPLAGVVGLVQLGAVWVGQLPE